MPSLFDAVKVPSLSGLGTSLSTGLSEIGATVDKKISYALADTKVLLGESVNKVKGIFGDVKNPFGKISSAVPNISLAAAKESVPTAGQVNAETKSDDAGEDSTTHKVKLVASTSDGESSALKDDPAFPVEPLSQRVVEFDVMPEVSEIHSAEYEPISAPQMPTEFQKYKGTKGVQWRITGVFTARTRVEAMRNYIYIQNLRSWTMPYFGENQLLQFGDGGSRGKLGAPPPVLEFSGWRGLVGKVPVVLTSLDWQWPKDCDWIPTGFKDAEGKEIPFPTVMNVNIALVESFSPNQVNAFDLVAFRNGRMVNAWGGNESFAQPTAPNVAEPLGGNGGNPSAIAGTPAASSPIDATTIDIGDQAGSLLGSIVSPSDSLLPNETIIAPPNLGSFEEEIIASTRG